MVPVPPYVRKGASDVAADEDFNLFTLPRITTERAAIETAHDSTSTYPGKLHLNWRTLCVQRLLPLCRLNLLITQLLCHQEQPFSTGVGPNINAAFMEEILDLS